MAERRQKSAARKLEWVDKKLMWAAINGDVEAVRAALELGADPNGAQMSGLSALTWAASRGHLDCLHVLLPVSNPHGSASPWTTPLLEAASVGSLEIVMALLPVSNVEFKDSDGRSAADHARMYGHGSLAVLIESHSLASMEASQLSRETDSQSPARKAGPRI